jgi:hypothetical protein
MSGQVWRRPVGRDALIRVPAEPDRLAATVEFVKWVERPGAQPEVVAGLAMELAEFQRAWDSGWMGMGPESLPPGTEWSFDSTRPVEVTACLARVPDWPADLPPAGRLDRIEAALADPRAASPEAAALRDVASWRYQSVVQERSPGVKMGFDSRPPGRP